MTDIVGHDEQYNNKHSIFNNLTQYIVTSHISLVLMGARRGEASVGARPPGKKCNLFSIWGLFNIRFSPDGGGGGLSATFFTMWGTIFGLPHPYEYSAGAHACTLRSDADTRTHPSPLRNTIVDLRAGYLGYLRWEIIP